MNQSLPPAEALALIQRESPLGAASLPQLRRDFSAFYRGFAEIDDLDIQFEIGAPLPGLWIAPPRAQEDRVVLFFHGGGYTIGSARDHADLAGRLARAARARVLSVDYRLAPENRFPAAAQDCLAAYLWLLDKGYPPRSLALAGISAGASLVLTTLVQARDRGRDLPAAAVCMSPAADLSFSSGSVESNRATDWITPARLDFLRTAYLADHDVGDPLASPIHADLAGLCPLLLQGGTGELLWDDIQRLADRLQDQGVPVELQAWPGLFHCWQIFAQILEEGREALAEAGRFLDDRLEG